MEVFDGKSDPKGEPCPLGPSDLCTSINWRVFVAIVIHFSPSKVLLSAVYQMPNARAFSLSFRRGTVEQTTPPIHKTFFEIITDRYGFRKTSRNLTGVGNGCVDENTAVVVLAREGVDDAP